ncbi:MAG: zinc ABC transporter substrate-binding protein [Verrucomicrobiota bacterium]
MKLKPGLAIAALCLFLCSPVAAEANKEKPIIYVPVLPYEFLFERIGGDWIEVHAIVAEGGDPHQYLPSPKQLAEISKATLLFSGELPFEGNFFVKVGDGVTAPRAIDLLEGLELLEGNCSEGHDHGHEHEHEHEENHADADGHQHADEVVEVREEDHDHHGHDHEDLMDPHVWLSPQMLLYQAQRIGPLIKEHTPEEAHDSIDANLQALEAELTSVDTEIREMLAPLKGSSFYVYHGAFAYFAAAYDLEQKAVEIQGRRPTPKELTSLVTKAKEEGVKAVFVQPQFDQSSAVALAESIGGQVKALDPLEKNVIMNLRTIAETIRDAN